MNTTFNFSRFLKVLSNEWQLNFKKILLFWSGIIIMTVIYFAIARYIEEMTPKYETFCSLFFFTCVLQGFYLQFYFREFSSKNKTQALLLLPASRNETFWAKFLLGVVLYVIVFSAFIFIAIKWNGIQNDWIKGLKNISLSEAEYKDYQTIDLNSTTKFALSLVWLFSISIYLFGVTLFKKQPILKTWGLWFIIAMGLLLVTRVVFLLFTGIWTSHAMFGGVISVKSGLRLKYGCDISEIYPEFLFGFIIFICLALILISRVKYNEKTI
ncbi:MAG: hypothetical protein LBI82_13375 [Dysgonamonadaceae bacterium]|jgi:hypothetical protein|nr:hypothetical protein [Dysgonamonadaceae bacterium]